MDNQDFFVDNFGNVINEFQSIEISNPLMDRIHLPQVLTSSHTNLSSGHHRSRYNQRIEIAMMLANIRSGRK